MQIKSITVQNNAGYDLYNALARHITIWNKLTAKQMEAFFIEAANAIEENGVYEIPKTYTWNRIPVTISTKDLRVEVAA